MSFRSMIYLHCDCQYKCLLKFAVLSHQAVEPSCRDCPLWGLEGVVLWQRVCRPRLTLNPWHSFLHPVLLISLPLCNNLLNFILDKLRKSKILHWRRWEKNQRYNQNMTYILWTPRWRMGREDVLLLWFLVSFASFVNNNVDSLELWCEALEAL